MIELQTLGRLNLRVDDGRTADAVLSQPKRFALLVYLALADPGGFQRRDVLIGVFWPELDRERARGALRKAVHFLRRGLGEGAIVRRGTEDLGLDPAMIRCDAAEFRGCLERGALQDALALYRGELLPGFFVSDAPEFERWLDAERAQLRRAAIDAAWRLAEEEAQESRRSAIDWARRAAQLDPGGERSAQRLIRMLDRFGDRAAALAAYEEHRRRLQDEVGLDPAPETAALVDSIRARPTTDGVSFRDDPASPAGLPTPNARTDPDRPLTHDEDPAPTHSDLQPDTRAGAVEAGTHPVRHPQPRHRTARAMAALAVASLTVVVAVIILALGRGGGDANPGAGDAPLVALGAIHDFTGSAERDLARSLADLFATSLAAGGGIQVLHPNRVRGGGEDASVVNARLARTARRAGATELIEGALYELPERRYRFDVRRLELASGAVRDGYSVVGANLFDVADLAAGQLRAEIIRAEPRRVPLRDATERIAVLPFEYRGRPDLAYFGEGIVPLLSATLDGGVGLRAVSPQQVFGTIAEAPNEVSREARTRLVAQRLDAPFYVHGTVIEVDGRLTIDAYLVERERSADPVSRASATGRPDELLLLVDRLTAQLLAARGDPGDRIHRLATTATTSLPALKAYLSGERLLRGGWFAEAMESFQHAVTEDTLFALAQYRLAVAAMWADREDVSARALATANRLRRRLPERDQQVLDGLNSLASGEADAAERHYRSILASYLDDAESWWQLGEVLFHLNPLRGRPIAEARYPLQQTLAFAPDHVPARFHLILLGAMERSNGLDTLIARTYGAGSPLMIRALAALAGSGSQPPARFIDEFRGESEAMIAATILAAPFASAELPALSALARLLTTGDRSPEARALGHILLAHLELARGRWRSASAELDRAESYKPAWALQHRAILLAAPFLEHLRAERERVRDRLISWDGTTGTAATSAGPWFRAYEGVGPGTSRYLLGLLYGHLGDPAEAGHAATALEQAATSSREIPAEAMAAGIRASLLWTGNRPREALQALESAEIRVRPTMAGASPFHALGRERYLRAVLLRQEERLAESLRWHASLEESTAFDLVYLGPSLVERGAIYERLGEPESAALAYRRFLDLWADADPELQPQVESARRRAEALQHPRP